VLSRAMIWCWLAHLDPKKERSVLEGGYDAWKHAKVCFPDEAEVVRFNAR
jgi:hypothetical protein